MAITIPPNAQRRITQMGAKTNVEAEQMFVEMVKDHTMLFQAIGGVLNIANMMSLREGVMQINKYKKESEKIAQIANNLMNAQLHSELDLRLKEELKDTFHYEYYVNLYRVMKHFCGSSPSYLAVMADELEAKEALYIKIKAQCAEKLDPSESQSNL